MADELLRFGRLRLAPVKQRASRPSSLCPGVHNALQSQLLLALLSLLPAHLRSMARFRAYVSDSEEEEDDVSMEAPPPPPTKPAEDDGHADASMEEDEVLLVTRRDGTESAEPSDLEDEDEEDPEEESEEESTAEDEDSELDERGRPSANRDAPPRNLIVPRGDPTIIPWARELGLDPQKMHVMQTSLFRLPEEERALKALNQPQASRKRLLLPTNLSRKHSRDSDGEGLRADSRQVCRALLVMNARI